MPRKTSKIYIEILQEWVLSEKMHTWMWKWYVIDKVNGTIDCDLADSYKQASEAAYDAYCETGKKER